MTNYYERIKAKLRDKGPRGAAELAWKKFIAPQVDRAFFPNHVREYVFDRGLSICIPVASDNAVQNLQKQISAIETSLEADQSCEVYVPYLKEKPPKVQTRTKCRLTLIPQEDLLSLYGYTSEFKYVLLESDTETKELEKILQKLHVKPFNSAKTLVSEYQACKPPTIKGQVKTTLPTYEQIMSRTSSGHYHYQEQLDWELISELPRKFEILSRQAKVEALPMSKLGFSRVARQYAIGKLFSKQYLSGESVLDVCCDLGGIKKFVGKKTRYTGVDMQGLPDQYVNLDKENLPFPDHSFETVLCFEALEHLQDIFGAMDKMMRVSDRYFIGSLFCESALFNGKSITRFGHPRGNAHLPLAPTFDRHQWIFTFADALDFAYYRTRKAGFKIVDLKLFFKDEFSKKLKSVIVQNSFHNKRLNYLARNVVIMAFVAERE